MLIPARRSRAQLVHGEMDDQHAQTPSAHATRRLLELARAGDADAERAMVESYRPMLAATIRSHRAFLALRAKVELDDVISEVWLRCYLTGVLRAFEYRGKGSVEALLKTLAARALCDLARHHAADKRGGQEPQKSLSAAEDPASLATSNVPSADPTPTANARAAEIHEIAARVLDPRELAVWRAIDGRGLDAIEMARRLETTTSAVRGVLKRARGKLLRELADRG